MTDTMQLIAQARERATTDSPSHELLNQLADTMETALAAQSESERLRLAVVHRLLDAEAALAAIEEGKKSVFSYWRSCARKAEAERDAALAVIERARGFANDYVAQLESDEEPYPSVDGMFRVILANLEMPPTTALAKVKADALREAADRISGPWESDGQNEWLRAEADRIEKEDAL